MENQAATENQRKASKKTKSKKKPIKVVYISNPLKVTTSASKFRALVQQLTGQDARFPNPKELFADDTHEDVGGNQTVLHDSMSHHGHHHHHHHEVEVPEEQHELSDFSCGSVDDVFMSQIFENFQGFLPSSLCCESSPVNEA